MNSGVSACSQEPIVEALDSKDERTSLVAEGLKVHPFWSPAKAERLENSPPYTDGPSRVILANDGTKNCLALLLTPDLVAALNQITHDVQKLERKDGALERIESEILDLACKANNVEEAIRNPRYQDRAEEMQLALEILHLKQQEAEQRKNQLTIQLLPLESNLKVSTYQSQAILKEALLEARLLNPPEPASPPTSPAMDDATSAAGNYSDAPSTYEGIEPTPEQQSLREARMHVIERYETLMTQQARFDDRHVDYEHKLAEFQRSEATECEGTRTHFDHGHMRHVQHLTRDLSAAEQGYRTAKARAKALELSADSFGLDSKFGGLADGGDRRSDDLSIERNIDRERIGAWTRDVLLDDDVGILGYEEPLDLDDWDARPVEIMDSISVIDREEYVDEISDWKKHCRVLREEASIGL